MYTYKRHTLNKMFDVENTTAAAEGSHKNQGLIRTWPSDRLLDGFRRMAFLQPDHPAVIAEAGILSYGELERRSNTFAHKLLDTGLAPQEAVGVLVGRSADLPLAFLAILKAGGVYVPMLDELPGARLADMAEQAGMRRLVALDGLQPPDALTEALRGNGGAWVLRPQDISDDEVVRFGDRPGREVGAADLAAILFTSGSTGRPKGVLLPHQALANCAYGHVEAHGLGPADRVLLATAPGFILGLRELCVPLVAGAAFVPISRAILDDPRRVLEIMAARRVSVALFTPSYLRLFQGEIPAGLRCLLTAGERPNADDARHYARHLDYWNMHGATEVCGTICMHKVDPDGQGPLASGRPFTNTIVHLLDESGREVGPGEVGEIHVQGAGLAQGYLNQPDLSAAAFVETAYGRAYRSHDLGRWGQDGLLETLGRADDVVKVSGQSVSLGEIERTLTRHHAVRRAAALQHQGRLVAFVETSLAAEDLPDWSAFLGQSLPAYMIPAQVAAVALLPIGSSGKMDRKSLLAAADNLAHQGRGGQLPRNPDEGRLATLWEEVLGIAPIYRDDPFFVVGGTSLLAITISQRLQAQGYAVTAQAVLVAGTIARLAEQLVPLEVSSPRTVSQSEDTATLGQEEFWIAEQIGAVPLGSRIARVLTIGGQVPDGPVWSLAWDRVLARHPALRAQFHADTAGDIHWRVVDELPSATAFTVVSCASRTEAGAYVVGQIEQSFDLKTAPLARAGLIRVDDGGETLFWFVLSHAVVDGLSARLLQEEIFALVQGQSLPSAANGIALAGAAERAFLDKPDAAIAAQYWASTLGACPDEAFAELPADRPRPIVSSGRGAAALVRRLDASLVAGLARLARLRGVGLHAVLLAVLAAETGRRAGRRNALIGCGISNRPAGAEQAIGHFVNLLPLALPTQATLDELILAAQAGLNAGMAHGQYPAALISRSFRQDRPQARPASRTALFDLSLTGVPSRHCHGPHLHLAPASLPGEVGYPAAGIDLAFSYEPTGTDDSCLDLVLLWNPDIFDQATAQAWLDGFADGAAWLTQSPAHAGEFLPSLLPAEAALLARWEAGPSVPLPDRRGHQLFEDLADAAPAALAVIGDSGDFSRAEIEARANGLAQALVAAGLPAGGVVGVLSGCSAWLAVCLLAVWKAGGVYLPLATDQPPERLAYMADDAGARVILVTDGAEVAPAVAAKVSYVLRPEDVAASPRRPRIDGRASDPAYVIYTSGTTGQPKGVVLRHDGLINAVQASAALVGLRGDDRLALVSTPGFDASVWELGLGLLCGVALVPVAASLRDDPWTLKQRYGQWGVSVAFHAPSYLRISRDAPFQGLRLLLSGGEAPNHGDVAAAAAQGTEFWNIYGPTETTILVSACRLTDGDPVKPLPAGRPLANTRISVRRADGSAVPPGVLGEIWLGGIGVGEGYLGRPELNAASFVDTDQGRFYRSGDLGRWTAEGLLELAGRLDHQVKLHGQRLELGEIEQALGTLPGVAEAVVLVDKAAGGTQILRGFVRVGDVGRFDGCDWHGILAERLPPYMIPASLSRFDSLPVTTAGKIDRDRLLGLVASEEGQKRRTPPRDGLEQQVATVWATALAQIPCREDNFFALGGNSLLAVTLAHDLSRKLGLAVPARDLFAAPSLAGFAARVAERLGQEAPDDIICASDLATEGEHEFWVGEQAGLDTRGFTMPLMRLVEGAVPDDASWQRAWAMVVARHGALRTYYGEDDDGHVRRHLCEHIDQGLVFEQSFDHQTALALIREHQSQPFSLTRAPLWRGGLVRVQTGGPPLLWLAVHHAVGDGRSLGLLLDDLATAVQGGALAAPAGDYAVSAARNAAYLAGAEAAQDRAHWRGLLAGLADSAFDEPVLDTARSLALEPGYHRLQIRLSPDQSQALRHLARRHDASLHALMLTLLGIEARRRLGRDAIIIGTPADMRENAAEMAVAGYYVNMLPLVVEGSAQISFGDQLRAVQAGLAAGLRHGRYPFARINQDFRQDRALPRQPGRFPLFDFAVTENPPLGAAHTGLRFAVPLDGLEYEYSKMSHSQDMVLLHEGLEDGALIWQWHVNAGLYRRETAESWLQSLLGWATWLTQSPAHAGEFLPSLLPAEAALLARWEAGPSVPLPDRRGHQLFEDLADAAPAALAVIGDSGDFSRAEIEARANGLAQALVAAGLPAGGVVGVLSGCSAWLAVCLLAVWKAGGVYLPLATDQPPERLAYMADDAGARVILVTDGAEVAPAVAAKVSYVLRPEDVAASPRRPRIDGRASDPAYVIYTSGTTGQPKGVVLRHDGLINAVQASAALVGLRGDDRLALVSTPGFDASVWELGLGLLCGVALVPVAASLRDDPWTLKQRYGQWGVSVAFHAPSYLRISRDAPFQGLRLLLSGGEAPNHGDVAAAAAQGTEFWNIYGPTETTILVSACRLTDGDPVKPLPAGRPLANTRISVRRADGSAVPPGVLGEIWLGGIGVGEGYLGRPELNAASFVDTDQGRFYRSGDLGRWTAEGLLELAGRLDHQVKLHGQRLELGEIEQALGTLPGVAEAVVLVDKAAGGTQILRGFVRVGDVGRFDGCDWHGILAERLPPYMIPASLSRFDSLPVTTAGKIDRDRLLGLVASEEGQKRRTPPRDGLEQQVATVWATALAQIPCREDNFFALGGNSLLAVTLAHDLSRKLGLAVPARDLFAAPSLAGFAARVAERLGQEAPDDIICASDLATEGEHEFWVGEQAGLDTRGFTMPLMRLVEGAVPDDASWQRAWAMVVARHGALRTYYGEDDDGHVRRHLCEHIDQGLVFEQSFDHQTALALIREHQSQPFSLTRAPLWRGGLVRVQTGGPPLLWLAVHHAVGDGRSLGLLLDDLATAVQGGALAAPAGDYAVSAARNAAYLAGAEAAQDRAHWRGLLAGLADSAFDEPVLDTARSLALEPGYHRLQIRLSPDQSQALRHLARRHDASLHALMLTLLGIEARRRLGRDAIIIGTPADMRENAAEMAVAGYYVNMLPLVVEGSAQISFGDQLRAVQAGLAAGLRHGRYPFARINQDFRQDRALPRQPGRFPLFDFAVTENPATSVDVQASLRFRLPVAAGVARDYARVGVSPGQDMVLLHEDGEEGCLIWQWQVNAALYRRETAEAWLDGLLGWVAWLVADEAHPRQSLPSLLPAEAALLRQWEQGATIARPAMRFEQVFEAVVDAMGPAAASHPAVIGPGGGLSYAQLEYDANVLAQALRQRGLQPGQVVGVLSGRSAQLPACVLGLWKAGAIYLPLAADLPPERLAYMANDAAISLLVALDGAVVPENLGPVLRLDDLDESFRRHHGHRLGLAMGAPDGAYILYTSGSTGRPKGTVLGHGGYVNMVLGAGEMLGITAADRCLMFASPSFDVSLSDLGVPLAHGAALCPLPDEVLKAPDRFLALLHDQAITIADVTPTYLRLFEDQGLPSSLRVLVTGGEAPFAADISRYGEQLLYCNAYGPTENTITSTMGRLRSDQPIHCGRPLPNTCVVVLDGHGRRLAPGIAGEVWLGGAGLALGYLGRDDLTAAAFVETSEGRLYRSGDLGRWLPEGRLEVLGRMDCQAKLRGQRLELGEIELLLESHPAVSQAVAAIHGGADDGQSLWAFVRLHAETQEPQASEWHDLLARHLPSYMIPAAVIAVATIPVGSSGKVDRRALVAAHVDDKLSAAMGHDRTAPLGPTEDAVAEAWAEQFGGRAIAREDHFFELGGDSLRAIAMVNRLRRRFQVAINDLYEHPILADFAVCCRPRQDHLRAVLAAAKADWQRHKDGLESYRQARAQALAPARARYERQCAALLAGDLAPRRDYRRVLLTGATGYVGSYLVRELLADGRRQVTALVRGDDDRAALARLRRGLQHYFGQKLGAMLADDPRLVVVAGDLRRDDLGLDPVRLGHLAETTQVVFHSAANVSHYGHYRDFHADNVAATEHLLHLAGHRAADPADFHLVSTISVCGSPSPGEFRLFGEDDDLPGQDDGNYYVATKQQAERLVIRARDYLANASIYRVGNVVFASDGDTLQQGIRNNAFFRQVAALRALAMVPDDSPVWLCHVDVVARAILGLAQTRSLSNLAHHLEHPRTDRLADVVAPASFGDNSVRVGDFGQFLDRLAQAVDEPGMQPAFAEAMASFGLYGGAAPHDLSGRLEPVSWRTNALLAKLGLVWPDLPAAGLAGMLRAAADVFDPKT